MSTSTSPYQLRARDQDYAALIERIADGDQSALATFHNMTSGLISGLLLRVLGNSSVAEEALKDVYQQVQRQAVTYDHRQDTPLTWLITIAHRRASPDH